MEGKRIVIVGGVATGPKTAARLRRLMPEAQITVIEQNEYISYGGCGMPLYVGGLIPSINDLMTTTAGIVRNTDYFKREKDINFLSGTVAETIDRVKKEVVIYDKNSGAGGKRRRLPYDKLVLATGAEPIYPPVPGTNLPGVLALHCPQDALALKQKIDASVKNIVIVGGGLIGLEVAEALNHRKRKIVIVEKENVLLSSMLDPDLAPLLEENVEANGVEVLLGESVIAIEEYSREGHNVKLVRTTNHALEADLVVLACGVKPNTRLARECGLRIGSTGGIVVDEYLTTSDPDIFAGGDCVENIHRITGQPCYLPLASIANKQGRVIANNIAGMNEKFPGVLGTTAVRVFDVNVGRSGLTEEQAKAAGFNTVTSIVSGLDATHYYPMHGSGIVKLIADRDNGRLLGVQVIGEGDVIKRLDVIASVIAMEGTIDDLRQMELAYAPMFATAIDLANHLANTLKNIQDELLEVVMPSALVKMTQDNQDLVFLDVRTENEVRMRPLNKPNVINIPLGELRERLNEVPRDRLVIVLCPLGVRAYEAVRVLKGAGFENVKSLAGGLKALPVARR